MTTLSTWHAVLARRPDSPHLRRLRAACERAGLDARVLTPARLLALDRSGFGGEGAPRAVLLRLASGGPPDELAALEALAACRPWPWFDAPARVAAAHDKAGALQRLEAAGLPVPPSVCLRRDDDLAEDDLPAGELVLKPARGSAGRGVTLGLDRAAALAHARAYVDLSGPALLQARRGDGRERRVVIVGGRVVAAMERRADPGDGRANVARGAAARAITPEAEERDLALAAAAALGLSVAGVDLLRDGDRPLVLEVNSCPGLEALEQACGPGPADALAGLLSAV